MKRSGFSLTEIVFAIAIIATAMIAVLGLLPVGLNASREAADSTVVATVLEDLSNRIKGQPLRRGPVTFSPAFYDAAGHFIQTDQEDPATFRNVIYRADVEILDWDAKPAGTGSLRPVRISLSWPASTTNGAPLGSANPKTVVTFAVSALTGPAWERIDRKYEPKVEL
ncbi:MAG TPA: prepilin-type N-terminal cleavage/methylation domain-containing protein [Chthoniobacteraceae bacterium]|nr:prepilin-type N-terminal cleavage/methylation domain-containing protein [Chthoniobacteraceae bacterium]